MARRLRRRCGDRLRGCEVSWRAQGRLQCRPQAESAWPDLPSPHMKSLKGEANLFELRPKQGASAVRPIYARLSSRFIVLAVAPNKRSFDRAVADAKDRLDRHR